MSNVAKNFDILAINLNILYDYFNIWYFSLFNILLKLFSDLYLTKFLDNSAKR